jgi:hypothetical protein
MMVETTEEIVMKYAHPLIVGASQIAFAERSNAKLQDMHAEIHAKDREIASLKE